MILPLSVIAIARNHFRKACPKSKCNAKSFRQRFPSARGGRERFHALIFAKHPQVLDLEKGKDAS